MNAQAELDALKAAVKPVVDWYVLSKRKFPADFTYESVVLHYDGWDEVVKVTGAQFDALAECERLKEAVWWMFEAMDTTQVVVSYTSDKAITRGLNGAESLGNIRENARKAVEELLK